MDADAFTGMGHFRRKRERGGGFEVLHPGKNELALFRSLKLKRSRIVYRIDDGTTRVVVVAIGHRKDIYEVILQILG